VHVLKIEYPVADYDSWKAAFDRDALDREGFGRDQLLTASLADPAL
jgi:hypothetical protein